MPGVLAIEGITRHLPGAPLGERPAHAAHGESERPRSSDIVAAFQLALLAGCDDGSPECAARDGAVH
jgi:hypothetical protein